MPCTIDKLSWNLYRKGRNNSTNLQLLLKKELNTQFGDQILIFSFNYSIVMLLTICAGREFQIFTILLKKKCFASFDVKTSEF